MSNKTVEEQIIDNDNSLNNINNSLNSYDNPDYPDVPFNQYTLNDQNTITNSWEVYGALSDTYKQLNITTENLKKSEYLMEEKKALEEAVTSNSILVDIISKKKKKPYIDTKTRIIEINNTDFRNKQNLINKMMYIIYFILYSIALIVSITVKLLSFQTGGIAFLLGLLLLIIILIRTGSVVNTYGTTSNNITKNISKNIIDTIAPIKKCPPRCVTKNPFEDYKMNFVGERQE